MTAHFTRAVVFMVYAANVVFAAVTFLKAKPFAGIAAIAVPVFAKARSPWSRWSYGPAKEARAEARVRHGFAGRFQRRLVTLVGGDP